MVRARLKSPSSNWRFYKTTIASFLAILTTAASMAWAQSPTGGSVASGSAQISQSSNATIVKQSSQRAIVDWRSFDVGRDHTVEFKQPGRSSATLNRVQSHRPSLIEGAIKAPGTVVIQNTAGVTFSGTARIDAGGLLATSQNVDSDRFLETGNFRIGGGERAGAVVENAGRFAIDTEGLAALVGSNVTNSGEIVAHKDLPAHPGAKPPSADVTKFASAD